MLGGVAAGLQQDCSKCKVWKRINQECRNFSKRQQAMTSEGNNVKTICGFIEQVSAIDSLKKVTPELCRALTSLKDSIKSQYESEVSDLKAQTFTLANRVEDALNLAERYRKEMEEYKQKF